MSVLTIAHTYYDNPGMLARHIDAWRRYSDDVLAQIRFLIVDDGSPKSSAAQVVRDLGAGLLPVAVYRVLEDIPWNWDGARNLAMHVATTDWVWLSDMDRLVEPDQAAAALALKKVQGCWYRPSQVFTDGTNLNRPHPNCYIVHRDDFWETGGHDEDFQGYWDKDKAFRLRLSAVSKPVFARGIFATGYRREDVADCDTRMGRMDSPYHTANAPEHLKAKVTGPFYVAERPLRFTWEREI